MPRSFKLPEAVLQARNLKDPQFLVRVALGVLLLANLVAAAFAFHWIGDSPEALAQRLASQQTQLKTAQGRRDRSAIIAAHMQQAKGEGDQFLDSWITARRHTYSTIIGEIT